jgi:hypothetical protein
MEKAVKLKELEWECNTQGEIVSKLGNLIRGEAKFLQRSTT